MNRALLFPLVALVGACASSTGVIPMGENTFSVMRHDNGPMSSLGEIKAAAYRDATAHCGAMNKKPDVVRTQDTPRSFGQFPQVEVVFRCV